MTSHHDPVGRPGFLRALAAASFCIFMLAACDSNSTSEDEDSIAGAWVGSLTTGSVTQNFTMTLAQVDSPVGGKSISGSGTVASPSRNVSFAVSGSYVHPILSLEAVYDVPPGTNPIGSISGQVNQLRTQITVTVSGPDISGQMTFTRDD